MLHFPPFAAMPQAIESQFIAAFLLLGWPIVDLCFSITSYGKTQMNFLANSTLSTFLAFGPRCPSVHHT